MARSHNVYSLSLMLPVRYTIYTTKIEEFVCPPNISETVADRIMKLAHSPRIASTMIKLISKPILMSILSILLKTIQRISAGPKRDTPNIAQINMDILVLPSGRSICIILFSLLIAAFFFFRLPWRMRL